jgi:hypothetical protein
MTPITRNTTKEDIMSSYQNSQARLRAHASAGVCAALSSEEAGIAATLEAQRILAGMQTTDEVVDLARHITADVDQVLRTVAPTEWAAAQDRMDSVATSPAAIADAVRSAFDATKSAVGQAMRSAVVEEIERFLQLPDQQFAFASTRVGESITVIEAHREGSEEVVMFGVDSSGQVQREYVQHQGVSCQERDADWLSHMAARGFFFDTVESDVHGGDRDGHRMYAPGAQRDAADPARGLVLAVESPRRSIFDAPASAPTTTQVRRAGGAG